MTVAQRPLYLICGISLLLYGLIGHLYSISTLEGGLLLAVIFLTISIVSRRPRILCLIDVWFAAFIYLYGSEYILERDPLLLKYGASVMNSVEGYSLAAFGASVLGYALLVQFVVVRLIKRRSSGIHETKRRMIPLALAIGLVVLAAISLVYIFGVLTLQQLLYFSRPERNYLLVDSNYRLFLHSPLVMLPIVSAYLMGRYRMPPVLRRFTVLMLLLTTTVVFLDGTRFYLLIVVSGMLYYFLNAYRLFDRKRLAIVLLCGVLVMVAQGVSRSFRGSSVVETDLSEMVSGPREFLETFLGPEAFLKMHAWIILSKYYDDPWRPLETLHLLYFWVPRVIWPDKPIQGGFWIVRELSGEGGSVGDGHAMSAGFFMSSLVDFGPIWGALFCVVYGMLVAVFEAIVLRYYNSHSHSSASMAVATLYAAIFYMFRSPYAALAFVMFSNLIVVGPFVLLDKIVRSRQFPSLGRQQTLSRLRLLEG